MEQNWGWNAEHLTQCMGDSWDLPSFQEGTVWGYLVLPAVGDTMVAWGAVRSPIKAPCVVPRTIQLATQATQATVVGTFTSQNSFTTLSSFKP